MLEITILFKLNLKKIDKLLININTYDSNLILNNNDEKNDILINSNNKFEWVEINYSGLNFLKIKFNLKNNQFIKIKGIKISEKSQYSWPWYDKIKLNHINKQNSRNFNFDINKMMGDFYCKNYNIVDDESSFILLKLNCVNKET